MNTKRIAGILLTTSLCAFILVPIQQSSLVFAHDELAQNTIMAPAQDIAEDPTMTSTPLPDPSELPVGTIFHKTQNPEKVKQLLNLYQAQVEQYRTQEREFQINKAQFRKLNTLQSLEEAVVSTQKALVARDKVLITYFELLHASLEDTEGVDVTLKSNNLKNLEKQINALKDHQQKSEGTTDRSGIVSRVAEFALIAKSVQPSAYNAISLIVIGNLQAVYDRSVILYADIKKYHADNPVTALKQGERERAYTQVDINIKTLATQLNTVRGSILNQTQSSDQFNQNVVLNLGQSYSGTALLLSHLKELIVDL